MVGIASTDVDNRGCPQSEASDDLGGNLLASTAEQERAYAPRPCQAGQPFRL